MKVDILDEKNLINVEIIKSFNILEELSEEWERLWLASPRREVFGMFEWAKAWWEAYGDEYDLIIVVVRENQKVIGILPLVKWGSVLLSHGWSRSDYYDLLCESGKSTRVMKSAIKAIDETVRSWQKIVIKNVPSHSLLIKGIESLPKEWSKRIKVIPGNKCSSTRDINGDINALDCLIRNKHLLRKEKRIAKYGIVKFFAMENRESIRKLLPKFFDQHIERRKLVGDNSMFLDEKTRRFYINLVEGLDPKTILRFFVLKVNEVVAAFHLGFELDNRFVCYKPTFNTKFAMCSPGEVMFHRIFQYIKEKNLSECDYTIGNEVFKERFSNCNTINWEVTIYPHGLRGAIERTFESFVNILKNFFKPIHKTIFKNVH